MLGNKNQQETDILTADFPYSLTKMFIARHLNKGANINGISSYNGKSILTIATQGYIDQCCHLDIIGYLLSKGANPFLQDKHGNSMFSIATKNINKQLLKVIAEYIILKRNIIGPNYKIPWTQGKTPMHIISELGTISQFLALLQMKGKVDIDDDRGNAPLDIIASGINKDFLDMPKETALKKLKIIENNLKYYTSVSKNQLLELKIYIGNLGVEEFTIDRNVSTTNTQALANTSKNQKSYDQDATNKLISLCCKDIFNQKKVMQLIAKGADINGFARESMIGHTNGRSPLTMLVRDYLDIRPNNPNNIYKKRLSSYIKIIIQCGGDPRKIDEFGDSATYLAHKKCDNELLRVMIFADAELYKKPQTSMDVEQASKSYERACR
ncbi:ankyrin repeat domain-containing protein [Wolbachia endosymbiont of Folsomia candida]|uniref:ankyrin repeat domain-containing protein n=1 Tax=Wolbachia endosymbiont of Folsomia candida TaxID=169402 RepID=UPI000B30AE78|nr:ankyrin repeat domain-containing protein [Wolbachia endosymbiont of Folsomia candida]APR98874.1 hypothetical protein ASM33_06670 [Wolbachia endosymbiont of Folsomia candida]